ncbi:MAG: hypothetical protein KIT72_02450 [Polyangiaceae bacterium]|nr:hypothetical protein [Polyangiaceae bacterium]MCW5789259.1 hypothetical protein [Polyangiaceae bacterium]
MSPLRFTAPFALLPLTAWIAAGCASGPDPIAFQNEVFYAYDQLDGSDLSRFEQRYPPLDLETQAPGYIGVGVLTSNVRFSRPKNWQIRSASNRPQARFIEYMSPDQYLFAIYERLESSWDPWRTVMKRYERDVTKSGGKILAPPVGMATYNAQGRAYHVERPVAAPKEPLMSKTREYLVRSDQRILLVQVVYQGESMRSIEDQVMRAIQTFRVY